MPEISEALNLNPFELPPPHSVEVEQWLLGELLCETPFVPEIVAALSPEDFYSGSHGLIFGACQALVAQGFGVNIISVSEVIQDDGVLERIGGRAYIHELAISHISGGGDNVQYHIHRLRDLCNRRKLLLLGYDLMLLAHSNETQECLQVAEKQLAGFSRKVSGVKDKSLAEIVQAVLDKPTDSPVSTVLTGYPKLDNITRGYNRGGMIILAARPGVGKSALALNQAVHIAARKEPVLFISVEMPTEEVVDRALKLSSPTQLPDMPLKIVYRPTLNPSQVRLLIQQAVGQIGRLSLVVVDYLQLMDGFTSGNGKRYDNRNQEISGITRALKQYAGEFDVPILTLCQLNRSLEARSDKRPGLGDLRDSGAIEQDADKVILLWRSPDQESDLPRTVLVEKNRQGPTGEVPMHFIGSKMVFLENKPHFWEGKAYG